MKISASYGEDESISQVISKIEKKIMEITIVFQAKGAIETSTTLVIRQTQDERMQMSGFIEEKVKDFIELVKGCEPVLQNLDRVQEVIKARLTRTSSLRDIFDHIKDTNIILDHQRVASYLYDVDTTDREDMLTYLLIEYVNRRVGREDDFYLTIDQ